MEAPIVMGEGLKWMPLPDPLRDSLVLLIEQLEQAHEDLGDEAAQWGTTVREMRRPDGSSPYNDLLCAKAQAISALVMHDFSRPKATGIIQLPYNEKVKPCTETWGPTPTGRPSRTCSRMRPSRMSALRRWLRRW